MTVRRVVTGHRAGRSIVVADEQLAGIAGPTGPGTQFWRLWGADEVSRYPDDGSIPTYSAFVPPVGGARVVMATLAPGAGTEGELVVEVAPEAALAAAQALGVTGAGTRMGGQPGLHATDSTDVVVVLAGRLSMALEEGAEVHLDVGDVVVQNGTQHAWRNHGTEPVRMLVFLVGAHGPT
jgi:quercetin dioxygenase-like cupin family protein